MGVLDRDNQRMGGCHPGERSKGIALDGIGGLDGGPVLGGVLAGMQNEMDRTDLGGDLNGRPGHREVAGQHLARLHEVDALSARARCSQDRAPPAPPSIAAPAQAARARPRSGPLRKRESPRNRRRAPRPSSSRRNCSKLPSSETQPEKPAPRTAAIAPTLADAAAKPARQPKQFPGTKWLKTAMRGRSGRRKKDCAAIPPDRERRAGCGGEPSGAAARGAARKHRVQLAASRYPARFEAHSLAHLLRRLPGAGARGRVAAQQA